MSEIVLRPSGAERWGNCAGSLQAQAPFPDVETEAARAGTAAHWVWGDWLLKYRDGGKLKPLSEYEGDLAPNGVIVDADMCDGAQIYVDDILRTMESMGSETYVLLIEQAVHMPRIHPQNKGTLDTAIYYPASRRLFLYDYKHGHDQCAVEDNLQLADYLEGLSALLGIDDQHTAVTTKIVQPFCYTSSGPIQSETFTLSDKRGLWNKLAANGAEALGPNPTLSTGKWCRHCKAVGVCSAARQAGYGLMRLVREPYAMDAMEGEDVAREYDALKEGLAVGKKRLDALEQDLVARLQRGETVGKVLSTSKGRENYTLPADQVVRLLGQLGVDAAKPGVLTPNQVRAATPAELKPAVSLVLDKIVRRSAGTMTLTKGDNTRASRAFKPRN